MIKLLDEIISNKTDCKGQIFRARLNTYVNSKGDYITTKKLLRLKRKSCPGCSECGFLIDDLN